MPMKNPQAVAQKWAQNTGRSIDAVRQGVQAVTVNPAEKAIARQDAYIAGVQRAVADGKYRRGLGKVTLQSWQDAMINKGLTRIAAGASAAQPKMATFMEKFLPYVEQGKQKLASMPRGDYQANVQRMLTMVDHLANFKM
jgi:predicted transcriptional regulator